MTIDPRWADLAATLAAASYAEVRAEAGQILAAEAARSRLDERRGPVVLTLVDGQVLRGVLGRPYVADCLTLLAPDGPDRLVAGWAIGTIEGSVAALRSEAKGEDRDRWTLGSWLRAAQDEGGRVRATVRGGRIGFGHVRFVGADHVQLLAADGTSLVVAWAAVTIWQRHD